MAGAPLERTFGTMMGRASNVIATQVLPAIDRLRPTGGPRTVSKGEFVGRSGTQTFAALPATTIGEKSWRIPGVATQNFDVRATVAGIIPSGATLFLRINGVAFTAVSGSSIAPIGVPGHTVVPGGSVVELEVAWQYGDDPCTLTLAFSATST